ncbi:MAG: HAD-IA family hydrolase [Actinomycetales bacterium]|jgi:pyrophosphatase PpaX|nr:HAD-IA family hydrolase [Candidatus Phosphoribacter baldrii]HRC13016.1 HAD-IA family hydrolase [Dermatophilaceae bacterium]
MTASSRALRWPTLVFDLDGTLVDTIGLIVASYQHAFRTVLGHEDDEARIRAWIGQPLLRCFQEAAPEHANELFAAYTAWNEANTDAMVRSYAGVADLLGDLAAAGARVAVATSKRRPPATRALELTGLTDLVPVVVTMEDTAVHKPDPTPLLLAVARVGGEPGRAAYIGDAVVDVRAAQAAGMAGIGVLWGAGTEADVRAAAPHALAPTVADLRALLLG